MAYQDRWVRGAVLERGRRECDARYALVRSVVASYVRPITVWDIGANLGNFGHRLATEYPASVVVMAESRPVLIDVCRENALPNVAAMTHRFSLADLVELAKCERPDVVLALNVLHYFGPEAESALTCLLTMGADVVIETPGRGDTQSAQYDAAMRILSILERDPEASIIGTSPSHVTDGIDRPMFRVKGQHPPLTAGYVYGARVRAKGAIAPRPHAFVSTETEREIQQADQDARPFVPGMNLWNWLQLGGSYPSRASVKASVLRAFDAMRKPHGDFRPWNLILQGDRVVPIDAGHRQSCEDTVGLRDTLAWIDRPELAYV